MTKEFTVAVSLFYLGHGGMWQSLSNKCCVGLSTATGYPKLFVSAAVVVVLKPVCMPGKPCADCLVHVKSMFSERLPVGIGNVSMTVDRTHIPGHGPQTRLVFHETQLLSVSQLHALHIYALHTCKACISVCKACITNSHLAALPPAKGLLHVEAQQ